MGYELDTAHMEAERNKAEAAYFEARPQIDNLDRRKVFDAGYERAWEQRGREIIALQNRIEALEHYETMVLERCGELETFDEYRKSMGLSPNAEIRGTPAALSPEAPLD